MQHFYEFQKFSKTVIRRGIYVVTVCLVSLNGCALIVAPLDIRKIEPAFSQTWGKTCMTRIRDNRRQAA